MINIWARAQVSTEHTVPWMASHYFHLSWFIFVYFISFCPCFLIFNFHFLLNYIWFSILDMRSAKASIMSNNLFTRSTVLIPLIFSWSLFASLFWCLNQHSWLPYLQEPLHYNLKHDLHVPIFCVPWNFSFFQKSFHKNHI